MTENQKNVYEDAAKATGKQISGYHYFLSVAQKDLLTHTGLVAYWPCNEIIGNQIKDLSGGGHHANLMPTPPADAPKLVTSYSDRLSNALDYDGTNDYVEAENDLLPLNQGSLEVMIKADVWGGDPDARVIMGATTDHYYGTNKKLMMFRSYGSIYFRVFADDNTTTITIGKSVAPSKAIGKYLFVTATWEKFNSGNADAELKLYINGVLGVADSGKQIDFTAFDRPFRLSSTLNFWDGIIDEPCIYNRVLSAAEVFTRYNFAKAKA